MTSRAAFQPRAGGASTNLAVTAVSQTVPLPAGLTSIDGGVSGRLVNYGTQTIFLRFDGTVADTTAGMPMIANSVEPFTLAPGASITVIAAGTGSTLGVTVGDGQ